MCPSDRGENAGRAEKAVIHTPQLCLLDSNGAIPPQSHGPSSVATPTDPRLESSKPMSHWGSGM